MDDSDCPSCGDGLLSACILDGNGGAKVCDWQHVLTWTPADGLLWLHLEYSNSDVQRWLQQDAGLSAPTVEALLAEETRPRSLLTSHGLLLTLRGVNLNPNADPDDLVAVRLWSDGQRIITTRRRRLHSTAELREALEAGTGPRTASEFVERLTDSLAAQMSEVIEALNDRVDELEESLLVLQSRELRPRIGELRREAIGLRRYLAPQREAMSRLYTERLEWMTELDRTHLRETADRTMRYIEDLDLIRERAVVVHEELMSRLTEKMDRTMYILSIVATVFLPLGFLTGLLGVNVGGIPGADSEQAFLLFCALLVVVAIGQVILFRYMKWM